MVSKTFPAYHPRAGEPTNFKEKILNGEKIHTIRGNFSFWEKRIIQIQLGLAELSVRQWIGKPYRSKQKEVLLTESVGIETISINNKIIDINNQHTRIGYPSMMFNALAASDGFCDSIDLFNWFQMDKKNFNGGAIIHFTPFRYITPFENPNLKIPHDEHKR